MISIRLRNLLEQNGIAFEVMPHDPAFSAQQLAARMHVRGKEFVKAVVVKVDGRYAIAAVPAHRLVDEKALARVAGAARCELATEAEFRNLFPECELGAMPPVGRLYDLPTYVDEEVTRDEMVVANAGTHAEAIRLRYEDLARVARPTVGRFGVPPATEQPSRGGPRKLRPARSRALSSRRPAAAGRKTEAQKKAAERKKATGRKKGAGRNKATGGKKAAPRKAAAGRKKATARKKAVGRKRSAGRKPAAARKAGRRGTGRARKATGKKKTAARKRRHS
jgi:Ala-tRNA(Pro) deacylase